MKDKLSPDATARIAAALAKTDWYKEYPRETDRMRAWREAKEAITQRVLKDLAAAQTRQVATEAEEAQAWLAKWTAGARYGH